MMNASPQKTDIFPETKWSLVNGLKVAHDTGAAVGFLDQLLTAYRLPIYRYVKSRGFQHEDAEDITQEYLARICKSQYIQQAEQSGGKLRAWILTDLNKFTKEAFRRNGAKKRGGDVQFVSIEEQKENGIEYAVAGSEQMTPDQVFDWNWALIVFKRIHERLRVYYYERLGKGEVFEQLQAFLPGGNSRESYATISERLETSEANVKTQVHRIRKHFNKMMILEIGQLVDTLDDVKDEVAHLRAALGACC